MPLKQIDENVIQTESGKKYFLSSLEEAIEEFNEECPKSGGIIIREHIGHIKEITHVTNNLKYEDDMLIADIDLRNEELANANMRPIISTPLRFESGVEVDFVLKILDVQLEI